MNKRYVTLWVCLLSMPWAFGQWSATGGPEVCGYGYTWKTSDASDGPTYDWIDIQNTGTEVTGLSDDNVVGPIQMGITFPYYWNLRTEVWIGSNGYLSFQDGNIASGANGFPPTPSGATPNDVIAPFMCDLTAGGAGNPAKVFYQIDAANQRFIVSYLDIPFWVSRDISTSEYRGSNSFQVILDARDSTITFQYQKQESSWDPNYDDDPFPMVVGLENVNARCGLMVSNADKPLPNTAVTFSPPVSPDIQVADVAPVNLGNGLSDAAFIPFSSNPLARTTLNASVANLGNRDIDFATTVLAEVRDTLNQLLFQEQLQVGELPVGATEDIQFQFDFVPINPGPYTFTVSVSNPADINAENNRTSIELVAVDTTLTDVTLSYASDNLWNVINPETAGVVSWSGGEGNSGAGVLYEFYGYPLIVKRLEFLVSTFTTSNPTKGFTAEMYSVDPTGEAVPGQLLFRKEMPIDSIRTDGRWTQIDVPISQGVIAQDGFYVAWVQEDPDVFLLEEAFPPISERTFEILDGTWAQYRSNRLSDVWIRAVVDISNITVFTNRDKPFEASRWELFPNPSDGQFQLNFALEEALPVAIKLMDLQGRKVWMDTPGSLQTYEHRFDLRHLPKGTYVLQLTTPKGQQQQKIVLY